VEGSRGRGRGVLLGVTWKHSIILYELTLYSTELYEYCINNALFNISRVWMCEVFHPWACMAMEKVGAAESMD
jgi:hypothetical protein